MDQNRISFTHTKEKSRKKFLIFASKLGFLIKERICSQGLGGGGGEQILSFKVCPCDKGRNVMWSCFIANIFLKHMYNVRNEQYTYDMSSKMKKCKFWHVHPMKTQDIKRWMTDAGQNQMTLAIKQAKSQEKANYVPFQHKPFLSLLFPKSH